MNAAEIVETEGRLVQTDAASGLAFYERNCPTPGFVACLERVHWGSKALRYYMMEVAPELARIGCGVFLTAETAQREVVGTYWLVPGELRYGERRSRSLYRTMLSVDERFARKGIGHILGEIARRDHLEASTDALVVYGFIERGNERALRVANKQGYELVRELTAPNIGWHRPRDDERVSAMQPGDRATCVASIRACYPEHVLPDVDGELIDGEYYVLREGGEVICGAQVVHKHMRITSLGGFSGWIAMALFSPFARWSPIFEVKRRHMLWLGNLFAKDGAERELARLFEALLAREKAHAAVAYFDPQTPLFARLERAHGFGPLASVAPATPVRVVAGGSQQGLAFLANCKDRPWLASGLTAT